MCCRRMAEYECASQGSYVGTQKRACVLGSEDGEWQKATGFCVSVPILIMIVLVVIMIIIVVIFFMMRIRKKAKAVGGKKVKAIGGVKGKKSVKSTKIVSKVSAKQVKV
ncbi:hypothetical protein JH06_5489 [Blastocystis sp. subtype 4]|uniref:hypothetical protein n=1 Tax=Blastocystis sp. subtype 4 TaxID=944170 RepID=UPI000711C921|nr:hypothetical protein JH06_5489 [Blastocystis sp. subtype 4]KNB41296.1 hypothetical protein JH06_5489 [Blastocystis sp. subtype 4]|eukprot:XP_014524739.1 hypothetical protein JH06_5489 [Blastocystis sp. subtype 4]